VRLPQPLATNKMTEQNRGGKWGPGAIARLSYVHGIAPRYWLVAIRDRTIVERAPNLRRTVTHATSRIKVKAMPYDQSIAFTITDALLREAKRQQTMTGSPCRYATTLSITSSEDNAYCVALQLRTVSRLWE